MHARAIRKYIVVGYNLRYLLDVSTEHFVYGKKQVLDTINILIRDCADCELHVTSRTAQDLYSPLVRKWNRNGRDSARRRAKLTPEEVALVRESTYQAQTVALSEAQRVFAYVTSDKRLPVDRLLANVPSLLSPGTFETLPVVARYDFEQAGRCIAFESPTAAAFHLMRATEDVLRSFYCAIVTDSRVNLMWGPIVADLRRRPNPPPTVLLNNLDNLRTGFRNPTQHPELIYDIEEAQDLFALSVDAVNRMAKYLSEASGRSR